MDSSFTSDKTLHVTKDITALDSQFKHQFSVELLKKPVNWVKNRKKLRNITLTLVLSILLAINQFFIYIRFSIFVNDVFYQLFLPSILSIIVIYWAEELEDIIKVSFGSLLLFSLIYSLIRMLPWLLGFISTGGTITLFFNIATIIQILPAISVMVLLGAAIAAILQEIYQ